LTNRLKDTAEVACRGRRCFLHPKKFPAASFQKLMLAWRRSPFAQMKSVQHPFGFAQGKLSTAKIIRITNDLLARNDMVRGTSAEALR